MAGKTRLPYRIYKRGDIYHAYFSFVEEGKRIQLRETTGRISLEEAESYCIKRAAELQQKARQQAFGELPCITLDEAFGRYFQEKGQFQSKPQNVLNRLNQIKSFLNIKYLHELDNAVLSQFVSNRRQNVANGTINRELAILSSIRNLAADIWEVKTNKANPQKFKLQIPAPKINFLADWSVAQKIIDRADEHLKPIIYTALYTFLRRGNILNLKWNNIDFVNKLITVKVKDKNTSGGKNLTIPMIDDLCRILQQQPRINEYVFNYHGQPIKDIKHAWHSIFFNSDGTSTGIPYIRFHDLRHTGLTWFVRKTGNILLAQKIAGHSSVKVTEIYAHAVDDDKRIALESVFK